MNRNKIFKFLILLSGGMLLIFRVYNIISFSLFFIGLNVSLKEIFPKKIKKEVSKIDINYNYYKKNNNTISKRTILKPIISRNKIKRKIKSKY